uniref:Wsv311-like protein n=1 Tax=Sicyonia whispovirus TaxID=2984283 RepID=A0A9C7BIY4_9VIRU|nr:MAG: wsv311-like protein [Sicyonia whispovirus]
MLSSILLALAVVCVVVATATVCLVMATTGVAMKMKNGNASAIFDVVTFEAKKVGFNIITLDDKEVESCFGKVVFIREKTDEQVAETQGAVVVNALDFAQVEDARFAGKFEVHNRTGYDVEIVGLSFGPRISEGALSPAVKFETAFEASQVKKHGKSAVVFGLIAGGGEFAPHHRLAGRMVIRARRPRTELVPSILRTYWGGSDGTGGVSPAAVDEKDDAV